MSGEAGNTNEVLIDSEISTCPCDGHARQQERDEALQALEAKVEELQRERTYLIGLRNADHEDAKRCREVAKAAINERDELAAKLAELEGQEPAGRYYWENVADATFIAVPSETTPHYQVNDFPLYARSIPAEPVNARLLDLLREAEKSISAAVRIEQHAHDEPPCPVSEWDYEAYRLAGEILSVIAVAEAQRVKEMKSGE